MLLTFSCFVTHIYVVEILGLFAASEQLSQRAQSDISASASHNNGVSQGIHKGIFPTAFA